MTKWLTGLRAPASATSCWLKPALLTLSVCWMSASVADVAQSTITIKLTVLAAPICKVDPLSGSKIEVNFGDNIGINKINSGIYRQQMNYKINCGSGSSNGMALKLTLKGTASDFNSHALKTSKTGLGVYILHDGYLLDFNEPLVINRDKPPELEALLIKSRTASLEAGPFNASATLLAEYE